MMKLCGRPQHLPRRNLSFSLPATRRLVSARRVIFSGIQPTGVPHIGNYLGALRQWVKLQDESVIGTSLFFSIVDLHAITVPQQASRLRAWKREALAALLAIGLDPQKSTVFYQSSVSAHSELMWVLSCTASMGYLSRMTQWKSKLTTTSDTAVTGDDASSHSSLKLGLFSYPVLQAADMLVHRATHVPVGDDQKQHLEFARECATTFNNAYGTCLVAPETMLSERRRVMSLRNPNVKMSKSDPDPLSSILITDEPEAIAVKVASALTDSTNAVSYDPINRPGVSNLLNILSAFDDHGRPPSIVAESLATASLQDLKATVADEIIRGLGDIRHLYRRFLSEDNGRYLDAVAEEAAKRARLNATETIELVREKVGL